MSQSDPFQDLVDAFRHTFNVQPPSHAPLPAPAPTITSASTVTSPSLPVYTSPMAKPAPYSGSAEDCNGFLLQVSLTLEMQPHLFPTDYSKVAIISLIGSQQSKCLFQFHPVEDRIHHAGMDGLLRNCATGCRVDEAFTMDDLVDSISSDTSGLRCGHVQLRIVFITPVWTVC
ncbi:hypothetical protein DPX16_13889 [Anabarilius grahami]|uniref:Uncharacterized protein n=1 Tax=Anabarilius grahami TaxID=495550 RepID=A0A3N0XX84_ANAGA|nr:hypothetical protein DPX16_13889 [Anabarilius grahami]